MAGLLLTAAHAAGAAPGHATLELRVAQDGGPLAGASVRLETPEAFGRVVSGETGSDGRLTLADLAPGAYRLQVEVAGFPSLILDVRLAPGERASVSAVLAPEAPRIAVTGRAHDAYGTVYDDVRLRDLPSSGSAWSLLETAEAAAITDRVEGGGMYAAEAARVSIHGSSWTQTSFRLGELDVTDPGRGGVPLLLPDRGALEAIAVESAIAPVETAGPGPTLVLSPRRPGRAWAGSVDAGITGEGLQSKDGTIPPIARFGSWRDLGGSVSGPLVTDRLGVFVAGRLTQARRLERGEPTVLHSDLGSGLAQLVATPDAGNEIRLLAAFQDAIRPFEGRARLGRRDVREDDRFLHLQAAWSRRGPSAWSVAAGYQRGSFTPDAPPQPSLVHTVERIFDGPVPELVLAAPGHDERWDLEAHLSPDVSGLLGRRHALRVGASVSHAASMARPLADTGLTAETVAGLPARLWDFAYRGESRLQKTDVAAFLADRVTLPGRVELEAGGRFESTDASPRGGSAIHWRTFLPRVRGSWRASSGGGLVFHAGWGRYRQRLPLRSLALTDPAGPRGAVYRWNDFDGDGLFQADEQGPLVARLDPAAVDPDLRAPYTDEVLAGLEARLGSLVLRFTGIHRNEHDLLETVNVGVPASRYRVTTVPDPGGDIVGNTEQQQLPIYDRKPASFGADSFVLTNPAEHTTLYEGAEIALERPFGGRFQMLLGATAFRVNGRGGNRGFSASENDQGVIGELFDSPNADTHREGRLFFDRAFTIKIAASYRAPGDLRIGSVIRYQDGQPFARLVIAPDLSQGPEAIQAIPRGRGRFTYTLTWDARLEKGFKLGSRRLAAVAEVFNLIGLGNEIEEDILTGPAYRTVTLVQPPRSFRLGARFDF